MKKILKKQPKSSAKFGILRLILVVFLLFVANSSESTGISQTFFTIAYFITAYEYLYKGFIAIIKKDFFNNEFYLFVVSILVLMLGINHAALVVNLYYYLYSSYEFISKLRRESVFSSFVCNVEHVNVLDELGSISVVTPEQIKPGDLIRVNPGECIVTDGVVTEGFSTVNTSDVTMDSEPYEISINDKVFAGYINLSSPFVYKSKTGLNKTHFDKECEYASESLAKSSKNYSSFDKYSRIASIAFLALSVILMIVSMFADVNNESIVVLSAVAVMLSVGSIGDYIRSDAAYAGISKGVLYKKTDDLVDMSEVKIAIFEFKDKVGDYVIDSVEVYDDFTEDNLKDIAACLYSKSTLPFASVINNYAGNLTGAMNISGYREFDHSGCFAYIDNRQVVSGTTEFMKKSKIHIPITTDADFNGVHFAVDGNYIGNIHFELNEFYRLAKTVASMRCCGVKHIVIFGAEDDAGASRIRNSLHADYFSFADDRTRVINDILENVPGKIALFGWHDWKVDNVKTIYLGRGQIEKDFIDADVVVSGKSVSRAASVINLAHITKQTSYVSLIAMLTFKIIVAALALCGVASIYVVLVGEFVLNVILSLLFTFKFKRIK